EIAGYFLASIAAQSGLQVSNDGNGMASFLGAEIGTALAKRFLCSGHILDDLIIKQGRQPHRACAANGGLLISPLRVGHEFTSRQVWCRTILAARYPAAG